MTGEPLKQAVKYDPLTGKKIKPVKFEDFPSIAHVQSKSKQLDDEIKEKILEKKSNKPQVQEELYEITKNAQKIGSENIDEKNLSEKVFTVLEPNVRAKLINLDLSEEYIDELARIFIYMTQKQQLKYLEEAEKIISSESFELTNFINEIQELPLSEADQKVLISQLKYLNSAQSNEYLDTLNKTVKEEQQIATKSSTENHISSKMQINAMNQIKTEEVNTPKSSKTNEKTAEDEKDLQKSLEKMKMERKKLLALKKKRQVLKQQKKEGMKRETMEDDRIKRVKELKKKLKEKKPEKA